MMVRLISLWNSNGMGCEVVAMLLVEMVMHWGSWCWVVYVCAVMC